MRPIRLVISGLNSFKEPQEINFGDLCAGNVFGIFGPTGSGKSSIIDAITLALYGKVERAARNVQGIVNKAQDTATVLFEFELGGGAEHRLYRVERKYVAKEDAISCRLARISDITDSQPVVLADKATQVDQAVQEILGLTVTDFTRAVVLPQGRFAEFLLLQGTERRRMLERIFGLEEYGEKLNKLVSERLKDSEAMLSGIEREMHGLGEASAEAVRQVEVRVTAGRAERDSRQTQLQEIELKRDQLREIRDIQTALHQVITDLGQHQEQQSLITELEHKLGRNAAASKLSPLLSAEQEASSSYRHADKRLTDLQAAAQHAGEACDRAKQELHTAGEELRQHENPLLLQIQSFRQAVALEERLRGVQQKVHLTEQKGRGVTQQVADKEAAASRLQKESEELAALLTRLQAELETNSVSPELREATAVAHEAEKEYNLSSKQLTEINHEVSRLASTQQAELADQAELQQGLQAAKEQLTGLRQELAQRQQTAPRAVGREQLTAAQGWLSHSQNIGHLSAERDRETQQQAELSNSVLEFERRIQECTNQQQTFESRIAELRGAVAQQELELVHVRQSSLAAVLANELREGEACPVCGSHEHPHLAQATVDSTLEDLESKLTTLRTQLEQQQNELSRTAARRESLQASLQEKVGALQFSTTRLNELTEKLACEMAKLPPEWHSEAVHEQVAQKAAEHLTELNQVLEERQKWQAAIEAARQTEQLAVAELSNREQAAALLAQSLAARQREIERLSARQAELGQQLAIAESKLGEHLQSLGVDELAPLRERLRSMDQAASQLSREIRQTEQKRTSAQQAWQQAAEQLAALKEEQAQVRAEYRAHKAQESDLQEEIRGITGGEQAVTLQTRAEATLANLRQQEEQCRAAAEEVSRQLSALENERSAASEAYRLAAERLQRAKDEAAAAVAEQGFVSLQEALEALDWSDLVNGWHQQITAFRREEQLLEDRMATLTRQLQGRRVSEADWQALLLSHAAAKEQYDVALQELGKAEESLTDIRRRHVKWLELEKERCKTARQRELLSELTLLLRGNALVEFMAGEHLDAIAAMATQWLGLLTRGRYALEVAPDGGFIIRDDGNGGEKRAVHTLSGGETFITSLALALALSSQVQLRGRHRLEFFFLDEGFGTLDPELLEVVMSCLERMQGQAMSIGIISHVPELQERIQRKVIVTPAERGGRGSRVRLC